MRATITFAKVIFGRISRYTMVTTHDPSYMHLDMFENVYLVWMQIVGAIYIKYSYRSFIDISNIVS